MQSKYTNINIKLMVAFVGSDEIFNVKRWGYRKVAAIHM